MGRAGSSGILRLDSLGIVERMRSEATLDTRKIPAAQKEYEYELQIEHLQWNHIVDKSAHEIIPQRIILRRIIPQGIKRATKRTAKNDNDKKPLLLRRGRFR